MSLRKPRSVFQTISVVTGSVVYLPMPTPTQLSALRHAAEQTTIGASIVQQLCRMMWSQIQLHSM